ncbi:MAG TPA: proton-conducting transporter membrane subunit, partial [Candidatus Angelobacter sp.]
NALAVIGIIYGALVALVQPNLKKLIAYSSVSHLGFVVLGIFSLTTIGANGAVYQMLNHGISTGALFMLAGMLYERKHTYEFKEFGGLATPMPVFATFFLLAVLSSVGLPLLNGFVGEFLVLSGAFQSAVPHAMLFATLATSGVIWGAGYLLWMYQKVFYGQITNAKNKTLADIDSRERISLVPLVVMSVIMGVASPYWMKSIEPAVISTIQRVSDTMKAHVAPVSIAPTNQVQQISETASSAGAASPVQKVSAAGGQK